MSRKHLKKLPKSLKIATIINGFMFTLMTFFVIRFYDIIQTSLIIFAFFVTIFIIATNYIILKKEIKVITAKSNTIR